MAVSVLSIAGENDVCQSWRKYVFFFLIGGTLGCPFVFLYIAKFAQNVGMPKKYQPITYTVTFKAYFDMKFYIFCV